jgi:predicted phosphodiesterase
MRSITRRIECTGRGDSFTIVPFGDAHLGNAACDERLLDETINRIANSPNTYWIGMGDFGDAINRHDKRHREDTYARWLWGKGAAMKVQRDYIREKLKPIGSKCLAYLKGNHEDELENNANSDMYLDIIESFGLKEDIRLDMAGFLLLRFGLPNAASSSLTFYLHHGWGGGDRVSGACLKLDRLPESYTADVYMIGHTHRIVVTPKPSIGIDGRGNIKASTMFLINTGTFLKCALPDAVTYSERKGMQPLVMGCPTIQVTPFSERNRMSVTI